MSEVVRPATGAQLKLQRDRRCICAWLPATFLLIITLLTSCSNLPQAKQVTPVFAAASGNRWWQPKADSNLRWYWQLQGEIDTSYDVDVYNIDVDTPQHVIDKLKGRGVRLICYFSVGTVEQFRSDADQFPSQVIGEQYPGYQDERWLDLSEYPMFANIMKARLDLCAAKGFDGVEGDNVDAFNQHITNVDGGVRAGTSFGTTQLQSKAYVLWLAAESHKRGLAFGLKNAESLATDVVDYVDWMITENCVADQWCEQAVVFVDHNKPVFMAEYNEHLPDFSVACAEAARLGFSAIYRDTDLGAPGIYAVCPD